MQRQKLIRTGAVILKCLNKVRTIWGPVVYHAAHVWRESVIWRRPSLGNIRFFDHDQKVELLGDNTLHINRSEEIECPQSG